MATLKDVAREAGLAVSTVSRILNNRGYISQDARTRVNEAMEKLNYQPNELARSLHRNKSNLIGLIVPHIKHPYFSAVISQVEDQAYRKGYRILLCNSQTMKEREQDYIEICRRNMVAGIIMCTGQDSLKGFEDLGVPVIAWERFSDDKVASIECDNVLGGTIAANHLIERGCRYLLHLGTNPVLQMPGDCRLIGFRETCREHGVSCKEETICIGLDYMQDNKEQIKQILKKNPDTDGIFANNDILAAQVIGACKDLSIPVPERMKVIGYDDVFLTRITSPTITSIRQPLKDMAIHAIQILDTSIQGELCLERTMFPVSLIERESTAYVE